jgi:gamma-glutamylcyclotransferase (GGCT)/AIG2-like uncharacterized protein YtfP
MLLFLYGSLLDPERLARRAGRPGLARRLDPAILLGWRRVALRGGRWPTLRRARGAEVAGVLAHVDRVALSRLHAFEGPAYRLARVAVRTAHGKTGAFAWIARAATVRPW